MVRPLEIAPGVVLWREYFSRSQQKELIDDVLLRLERAPLYRPVMPRSGKAFSVDESNFGSLGWYSDTNGYRYVPSHPVTGEPWPVIPGALLELWRAVTAYPALPECCLVNLYRALGGGWEVADTGYVVI